MRVLVHDYSGHPFQAQLSRELARRGHQVTHSYCPAYVSGKGNLESDSDSPLTVEPVGAGIEIHKMRFRRRVFQEMRIGLQLASQALRIRPQVVMASNVPIPTLVVLAAALWVRRIPWVLWHQDVQGVAIRSFADGPLSPAYRAVAAAIELGERWCARKAAAIVVIADSFLDVHRRWGTEPKVSVIPNWAPLDEINPVPRKNDWAVEHELDTVKTLLYSGTLGLKHNPELLVELAHRVIGVGQPVRLVVVNEGPAVPLLRAKAEQLGVPLDVLPFQPYERLSEVLGSGDVLVVLLESGAGQFSVPSKTLSYLCAGRPVLGLMPAENLAAQLIKRAGGCVLPPDAASLDPAASWIKTVLEGPDRAADLGDAARDLAESEFSLEVCTDRFEQILAKAR